jgi:hypothetical protein
MGFHFESSLDGDASAAIPLSGVTLADRWSRKFSEPIELPNGERLIMLQDAIVWFAKSVPASERDDHEVQVAAYYVTEAAENNGPMAFARIGMLKAINRHKPRELTALRKPQHWGKPKLKRDQ